MTTDATLDEATEAPVFDTAYVASVFNQRGYHVNEFAGRLDLSNNIVEAFLRGTVEPGDLRIATLVNMANLLGIPLHTMFSRPAPLPDPETIGPRATNEEALDDEGNPVNDAEQLIATLYDTGRATPTLISELATAFGWTTDRTYLAAAEANRRLSPAGLQVITSHGELFVTPINNHSETHAALLAFKTYERGFSYTHYKAVHQLRTGQLVTVNKNQRQRLRTLGLLVNLGVLTQAKSAALTPIRTRGVPLATTQIPSAERGGHRNVPAPFGVPPALSSADHRTPRTSCGQTTQFVTTDTTCRLSTSPLTSGVASLTVWCRVPTDIWCRIH